MIGDAFLRFTPEGGALPPTLATPHLNYEPTPFPGGFADASSYDLGELSDLAGGKTGLKARFEVIEGFAGGDANYRAFFGILVARDASLTSGAHLMQIQGPATGATDPGYTISQLSTAGQVIEVPIGRLPSISRAVASDIGFRYVGLCMVQKIPGSAPSGGLVRADIRLDTDAEQALNYRLQPGLQSGSGAFEVF